MRTIRVRADGRAIPRAGQSTGNAVYAVYAANGVFRLTADYVFAATMRQHLARNIAAFAPVAVADPALRRAAVGLVVMPHPADGQCCLLLTRRPQRLNRHSGQYALPGGRVDAGETAQQAALRELDEELGLALGPEAVLGILDDYPTRSGFRVTPVVLWGAGDAGLKPSAAEVAAVFHIPFTELVGAALPLFEDGVEAARPVLCAALPTLGHRLYAPTAAMLYQFREVAILGHRTRVAHYDQPQFAWQ